MIIDSGKQAEYAFASEALRRGLVPFWPSTATGAIDLVICTPEARASRIQVKASQNQKAKGFNVSCQMIENGKHRKYTKNDVDFIAVFLSSLNIFYIIPIRYIKGQGLYIRPEDPRCSYARFKEAWSLLR